MAPKFGSPSVGASELRRFKEAGFVAGAAFVEYLRHGDVRKSPLPDFTIGAHDGALSHCRAASAKCRRLRNCQAAATAVRHVVIAAARSVRCVWAEMRWRWTLKVL